MRYADLIAAADVDPNASHVMCHAYDGYTTNLPLVEAVKPDVLLVHHVDGAPLPREPRALEARRRRRPPPVPSGGQGVGIFGHVTLAGQRESLASRDLSKCVVVDHAPFPLRAGRWR